MLQKRRLSLFILAGIASFAFYILLLHITPGHVTRSADFSYTKTILRFLVILSLVGVALAILLHKLKIATAWLIALLSSITTFGLPTQLAPIFPKIVVWVASGLFLGLIVTLFNAILNEWKMRIRYKWIIAVSICALLTGCLFIFELMFDRYTLVYYYH